MVYRVGSCSLCSKENPFLKNDVIQQKTFSYPTENTDMFSFLILNEVNGLCFTQFCGCFVKDIGNAWETINISFITEVKNLQLLIDPYINIFLKII